MVSELLDLSYRTKWLAPVVAQSSHLVLFHSFTFQGLFRSLFALVQENKAISPRGAE